LHCLYIAWLYYLRQYFFQKGSSTALICDIELPIKRFINYSHAYPLVLINFGIVIAIYHYVGHVCVDRLNSIGLSVSANEIDVFDSFGKGRMEAGDLGDKSNGSILNFEFYWFCNFLLISEYFKGNTSRSGIMEWTQSDSNDDEMVGF